MRLFYLISLVITVCCVGMPFVSAQDAPNSICVFAFEDVNENGIRDAGEIPFPGINVTIADESNVILANHITTALDDVFCFEALTPATYQLTFEDSPNHRAVMQNAAPITLDASQRVRVEFGAVRQTSIPTQSEAAANRPATALDTTERLLLAGFIAAIAMGFMVGLGMIVASFRL